MSIREIYKQTLKGTGGVKGSSGKPKLPRRKTPGKVSTDQYKMKKGKGY